jgi:hypothetical protein
MESWYHWFDHILYNAWLLDLNHQMGAQSTNKEDGNAKSGESPDEFQIKHDVKSKSLP